jgi:hypothetical protein
VCRHSRHINSLAWLLADGVNSWFPSYIILIHAISVLFQVPSAHIFFCVDCIDRFHHSLVPMPSYQPTDASIVMREEGNSLIRSWKYEDERDHRPATTDIDDIPESRTHKLWKQISSRWSRYWRHNSLARPDCLDYDFVPSSEAARKRTPYRYDEKTVR